jgi:hypothetical protein
MTNKEKAKEKANAVIMWYLFRAISNMFNLPNKRNQKHFEEIVRGLKQDYWEWGEKIFYEQLTKEYEDMKLMEGKEIKWREN